LVKYNKLKIQNKIFKNIFFYSVVWGMRSYLLKNPETETETKAAAAEQQVTKNKATKL